MTVSSCSNFCDVAEVKLEPERNWQQYQKVTKSAVWKAADQRKEAKMSYTAFFSNLWIKLFGTMTFAGINLGFWAGMAVVGLFVIIENIVFWSMRPVHRAVKENGAN